MIGPEENKRRFDEKLGITQKEEVSLWVPDRTNIIQLYNTYYLPTQIYYPPTFCIIHQLFCIIHQLVCIIYQVTCIIYQNLYYLPTRMYYPPTTCIIHRLSCIIHQLRFYYPPTPVTQTSQCRVCRARLMFKLILESVDRSFKNTWVLCVRNRIICAGYTYTSALQCHTMEHVFT